VSRAPQRFGDSRLWRAVWQAVTDSIPVSRTSVIAVQRLFVRPRRQLQIGMVSLVPPHGKTEGQQLNPIIGMRLVPCLYSQYAPVMKI
jgi:hypothetical protein